MLMHILFFYSQFNNQVNMNRKSCFCIFFIVLLISPGIILAKTMKDLRESKNRRWAQALLPIWTYTQMTVSAPLFAALVAAYGIYAVTRYGIKKGNNKNCLPTFIYNKQYIFASVIHYYFTIHIHQNLLRLWHIERHDII